MMEQVEKPDWFNLSDYDVFEQVGVAGWATILRRIFLEFQSEWGEDFDTCENGYSKWVQFRMQATPYNELVGAVPDEGWLGGPAIQDIRLRVEFNPDSVHINDMEIHEIALWELHYDAYPATKIDLHNPDEVIRGHFERWLMEKRKNYPLPLKQPGRPSRRGGVPEFSEAHARLWAKRRIIALWDLQFWAENKGFQYSNAELFALLYPDEIQEDHAKYVSETRRLLANAFDLSVTLQAQAASQQE